MVLSDKQKQSEEYRKKEAARKRRERASATDIGGIDDIDNPIRRAMCERDFGLFCKTYLPDVFALEWSSSHKIAIRRIQEAVLVGGSFAFAMPRGSGKSSLSRAAVLWAILYQHSRYTYLIGANAKKAQDALDTIKVWLRYVEPIVVDFPEICQAIVCLNGVAQRAASQKCGGTPTEIEWTGDRVVLPSNPLPGNHPEFDSKDPTKLAPSSGAVIGVSGLDGAGIRGSTYTTTTGNIIRPDFVVIDDPQTDDSAKSKTQVQDRLDLINGAVLKMSGPGVKMRGVIPCTIIRQDDLAHRVLDKKQSPFWRGEVTRLMESMPANMEAWDRYFAVYEGCLAADELDMSPANDYYLEHREELDEGAVHSWPERFNPDEISAIQNAMNLYYQDQSSFMSEMQNDPIDTSATLNLLTVEEIQSKQSPYVRNRVPDPAAYLTCHIDVHKHILYYSTVAWQQDFTGYVVDYGTFPEQNRRVFNHGDIKTKLSDVIHYESEEEQIHYGLEELVTQLSIAYESNDGSSVSLSKVLIDSGYQKDVVEQFCLTNPSILMPMAGKGVKATEKPLMDNPSKDTVVVGYNWLIKPSVKHRSSLQWCLADVNFYKTFMHERLVVGSGGSGCLEIFAEEPRKHEMFASHLRAEVYDEVFSDRTGRRVKEWQLLVGQDNHYFDTLVGNCVAASILGCQLNNIDMSAITEKKKKIKRVKFQGFRNGR